VYEHSFKRVKTHGLLNVLLSNILAELDPAGEAKKAMEEMKQITEERGGRCLSDIYADNRTRGDPSSYFIHAKGKQEGSPYLVQKSTGGLQ